MGGFRFYGTRSDDPNDVVAHEHRRELRAYGTFAAWLNHVDSKSINTLDTLVDHDGRTIVRHHLLDFGSTIGSAGVYPREAYEGSEYLIEGKKTLAGIPTFGFYVKEWRTAPRYRSSTVGSFPSDNATWDPEAWKPRYANSAFRAARMDDKFWAALRLQHFSSEMLKAVTGVGQFNDPASEAALAKFLIDRRDAIVRRYLPAVNPVVDVQLTDGKRLTFRNAAVDADDASLPMEYVVNWLRFDNATGATTVIGTTTSAGSRTSVPVPLDLPSDERRLHQGGACRLGRTGELERARCTPTSSASATTGSSSGSNACPTATRRTARRHASPTRGHPRVNAGTLETRIADTIERNRAVAPLTDPHQPHHPTARVDPRRGRPAFVTRPLGHGVEGYLRPMDPACASDVMGVLKPCRAHSSPGCGGS